MKKKYLLALLPSIFYINSISAEDSTPKENPVLNKNEKHMNGYDTNGNPISIDTSSLIKDYVSGKIYSQDGSVYVDKGTYEIWDNRGKTIIKDCSKSLLLTDPYVEPSAELGELPGPECYFQKIKYHEDGSEYETIKYQEDGSE